MSLQTHVTVLFAESFLQFSIFLWIVSAKSLPLCFFWKAMPSSFFVSVSISIHGCYHKKFVVLRKKTFLEELALFPFLSEIEEDGKKFLYLLQFAATLLLAELFWIVFGIAAKILTHRTMLIAGWSHSFFSSYMCHQTSIKSKWDSVYCLYICVIRLIRRMNAKVIYLALLTSWINRKEQQPMRTNLFTCNVNSECNV